MAFELPESLDALTPDELQALLDRGLDAYRGLEVGEDSPEETLAEGERIAPLIAQIRTQMTKAQVDALARRDRARHLMTTVGTDEPGVTPEPESPPPEPETPEPEQPQSPQPQPGQPQPTPTPPQQEPSAVETITPTEVIQPAIAAGGNSPVSRAAANSVVPVVPVERPAVSLIAAADVPGIPTGSPLEGLDAVCAAVLARMRGLPNTRIGGAAGVRHRYGAAYIRKNGYGDLTQEAGRDDYALVWEAGNEARLPGGSLVAAMGWCAPSETLYDLCQFETVEGILSIPEFQVTRGGIRWTQGPDFADIYEACGFQFSEAEVIADTAEKNCCIVDCPPFDEIRLDLIGLCVKTPLLTNAAYPELVRRFMEGALVAHQHKVNKYILDTMTMAAGTPSTVADSGSLSRNLSSLAQLAIGMRYRYRLSQTAPLEVVAPFWLRDLLREDLGLRQFPPAVSDAAINQWFSDRNMSVQWVYDFQDPEINDCQATIPDEATILIYPAGTWVKGSADVINIDAVYDSTGLSQNVFTALFMEEGILAVQRCTHTCAVTIPICVSGRAAANDITECLVFSTGGESGGGGGQNAATGATAGTPGTWTPSGSDPAPSPSQMSGVTASPATAWTTGQYVQTATAGTTGRVYWNGTAWVQGAAS